jgi:hypothetical protein
MAETTLNWIQRVQEKLINTPSIQKPASSLSGKDCYKDLLVIVIYPQTFNSLSSFEMVFIFTVNKFIQEQRNYF